MRNYLFSFIFGATFVNLNGQVIIPCGTDEILKNWFRSHRELKADFAKQQQAAKTLDSLAFMNGYSSRVASAPVYTIPIVFHVLHIGGAENITDAQIMDELSILNRDYRKQNADTINIYAPFHAADINFEFRLATRDTNGNCTTGITRHFDPNTYWDPTPYAPSEYKYTWDPTRYLNVYIVYKILSPASAYSSLPGLYPAYSDVIVINNNHVGSFGTSYFSNPRTLTHEIGHWFNLHHVWGDTQIGTVCGDDGVSDTPITKGWSSCTTSPSLTAICNPPINENFQNYMDYSGCTVMFTAGQAARMNSAITSSIGGRNNIWTNSNLIATGVINPISPCTPIAAFYSNYNADKEVYKVCLGESLTFRDISYNGTITAYSWSVTGGGAISAPTTSITNISFPTIGTQTVTYSVTNSAGTGIITKTVLVVNNTTDYASSYSESFESPGLPSNFSIISIDPDVTWAQCSQAAATGTNSYFINGSLDAAGTNPDILETPSYDFLNNPNATFTFKYAYAKFNTANTDVFKVQVSSNCGGSWTTLNIGNNTSLSNGSGGTTTTPFVPTSSQFILYDLTAHPGFSPFSFQPNVKIRFYFKEDTISGYGNNIYLDDINFSTPSGINELTKSILFNVNPNPSSAEVNINFTLSYESQIAYFVTDIIGRIVEPEKSVVLGSGNYTYKINENKKLKSGIYFLNFEINGQKISRKIIIAN